MKRKMIFAAIAAIATVSGIAGFNIQNQESKLNDLTLANFCLLYTSDAADEVLMG